ncbi:DUF6049 family protein [Parasphingorhabdus pacifica]
MTNVTPSVVGPGAPPEMTVKGRLTNTGDQVIEAVEARIQRSDPAGEESDVHEALGGNAPSATTPSFNPLVDTLEPGRPTEFEMRIPITGDANSLQITEPGVHPILLNINGSPNNGSRARIGEARFLLPVTAVPGQPPTTPPEPTPTTMLVPVVDFPRLQQQSAPGQPAVLIDDNLADSLAPGGRLHGLLQAVDDSAGSGSPMGSALCFAVDPDLIVTVDAMIDGYQVRNRDGSTRPGTGAASAEMWLDKLKTVTQGRCVISLPFGDVDVTALGRADLPDLIKGALDGSDIVERVLGVKPRRDMLWPIAGALDEPAAGQLTDENLGNKRIHTMLMRPSALAMPQGSLSPVRLDTRNSPIAQPIDPLMSRALNPLSGVAGTTELSPPHNGPLSAQDALGALTFRATKGATQGTSVIAPPRRWNIGGDGMRALLEGMGNLADTGYIQPTGLPSSDHGWENHDSAHQDLPQVGLDYPGNAANAEIRQPILEKLARENFKVGDLYRSSEKDPAVNRDPAQLTTPLRDALLRGASSAWRGDPGASRYWVGRASDTIEDVLSHVQLAEFRPIMQASSNAYIPVTVTNNLPVTISVELKVPRTVGIEPKDLGTLRFPAQGRRTIWLETEVHRAGQFTVDLAITTEDGTQLGEPRRLQVHSNAYGQLTVVLTIIAGALLVVLSALRIVRRIRARNDRKNGAGAASGAAGPADNGAGTDLGESAVAEDNDGSGTARDNGEPRAAEAEETNELPPTGEPGRGPHDATNGRDDDRG